MQTINRSVVVIGAGPAGIGAGLTLKGECTVLERTASIRWSRGTWSTTMGHSTGLIREQCPVW